MRIFCFYKILLPQVSVLNFLVVVVFVKQWSHSVHPVEALAYPSVTIQLRSRYFLLWELVAAAQDLPDSFRVHHSNFFRELSNLVFSMLLLQPLLSSHIGWPKTAVLVVYKEKQSNILETNQYARSYSAAAPAFLCAVSC